MERIDTPEKVKTYLEEQGIDFDNNVTPERMYMMARRRLRRRLIEAGDSSLRRNVNIT